MNESQLRELVELQRELIAALQDKKAGFSMRILDAKKRIQSFEDSLACNQEFKEDITPEGFFVKNSTITGGN